ncbi:MAG: CDP-diacylglycerol--serine O-phosphatidyltransferase [Syntrophobacteraceae bacterium]
MQIEAVKKRRSRRKKWRKEGEVFRGTHIWPNLFTTANLLSGFFGIVKSINGDFEIAAIAVLASCVFDILDGKVARLTGTTSRFGVEYDSLADLVAFGVAPGLLIYLMALKPYGRVGWLAAFVFVACGALRLARFNVQAETSSKKYFVGLPIPGGATMIATTVLFMHYWPLAVHGPVIGPVLLVMTYALGSLMISTVPFNSFKDIEIIKARPSSVVFGVIVIISVIAVSPPLTLFLTLFVYTVSGPLRWTVWKIMGKDKKTGPLEPLASDATVENASEEPKPVAELVKPGNDRK